MLRPTVSVFLCIVVISVLFQPLATDAQGDNGVDLTALPMGRRFRASQKWGRCGRA